MRKSPGDVAAVSGNRIGHSLAVLGVVLAVVLLPLGLLTSEVLVWGVPLSLGIGCLLYLSAAREPNFGSSLSAIELPWERAVPRLIPVGLAGLVTIAALRQGRPLPFVVLAGIIGSLFVLHIAFASGRHLRPRVVLVGVVVYAGIVRFAALLTTPGLIGIDTWTHVTSYAAAVQSEGSLAAIAGIKYSTAPFYHLVTVAGAELLGVSLRDAAYLTVGVALPLSVVSVYLAGRYVVGVRWGLFAALAFAVSEHVIEWSLIVATTSLGLVFFVATFLVLVRILYTGADRADYQLVVGFSVAVALTHQMSSFVLLTLLGTATAVLLVNRGLAHSALGLQTPVVLSTKRFAAVFGTYAAFTTALWSITPWARGPFLQEALDLLQQWIATRVGFLNIADTTGRAARETTQSSLAGHLAPLVDNLGFLLLLLLAVVGCLTLLQSDRSVGSYTLVAVLGIMALVTLGFPLFGFEFLLPDRWYAFMAVPMALVAAVGLRYLFQRTSSGAVLAVFLLFALAFPGAMVLGQAATIDEPTFPEEWPRYAHTQSELDAVETIHEVVPRERGPVYTDHPFYMTITRLNQDPAQRRTTDPSNRAAMLQLNGEGEPGAEVSPVVYRTYQSVGRPTFEGSEYPTVVRQLTAESVCGPERNHVYANQDVRMCTVPGT